MVARFLVVAAVLCASSAFAQTVTDGDTIKLNGTAYRLWGIDAPESKQTCIDGSPAGRIATRNLVSDRTVECEARGARREARGKDKYGRTIGLCKGDGQDLSALMVRAGMAWAFRRYSHGYVLQEGEAQAENLGVHAHECQPAWEWRARQRGGQ